MNKMKLSKLFYSLALATMATGLASCGDGISDYIPPAIHPHGSQTDTPSADSLEFTPHVAGEPYDTYKGLIMCGYQGWFGTPGDGSPLTANPPEGWYHYRESNSQFKPGVLRNSIDFWPDMSEYEKVYTPGVDETSYSSVFVLPDLEPATLYSPYDESSVLLHFKWMQEYGIDGVFMQRFLGEITTPTHKDHFDVVLANAMKGSNQYQRAISVMYDLSSAENEVEASSRSMLELMVKDAQELMDKYELKQRQKQPFYLFENGKPLLALWGVGFNGRKYDNWLPEYIDQLKAQGWSIMLGCPAKWRDGGGDAKSGVDHGKLINIIKSADVIMPWYVGRYDYDSFNNWKEDIAKDIQWAKDNGIGYAVHVYPGGSDRNMHPNNGMWLQADGTYGVPDDPTGGRYGGKFYWNQLSYAISAKANSIYVGMFDEIDEGTAIFKQLNVSDVPSNIYADDPDYWVTYRNGNYSISSQQSTLTGVTWSMLASELNVNFMGIDDDLPTDHYLWLTGKAAEMLNQKIPFTEELPNR